MKIIGIKESSQRMRLCICKKALLLLLLATTGSPLLAVPSVTRTRFIPPVIPLSYTQIIRFEATVTEHPASVAFEYNWVDRPMYDDGTHGDRVAGDGEWTILFQPNEILNMLTTDCVYRPFIGYCKPAVGWRSNIFAEIWTPDIGLVNVEPLGPNAQQTDYLLNFTASTTQLMNFNAPYWANRFYSLYSDKFDFLQFLHVDGIRGNRYHDTIQNDVQGIGKNLFNNSPSYGSAGRLKGYTVFPVSFFFDCGDTAFNHETGHQWINFLNKTPFGSGIPHWPKGDIAINEMGFSEPGSSEGLNYSYTFTPNGSGGFIVASGNVTNTQIFNTMELYLMGLVPPAEVGTFFILKNQNLDLTVGQTLQSWEITPLTVDDVIAAHGPRVPASTSSQKTFRCATVVLSEQLLDAYAMSFYDWFARRAEAKQRLNYASGFATGTCNPFYSATDGRAVMFSKIKDDRPSLNIGRLPSGDLNITFIAKVGIRYQPQISTNLATWINQGSTVTVPFFQPSGEALVSVPLPPLPVTNTRFYRVTCEY